MSKLDEVCYSEEEVKKRRINVEATNIEVLTQKVEIGAVRDEIKRRIKIIIKLTR